MQTKTSLEFNSESLRSAELFRLQMDAMARPGSLVEFPADAAGVASMNAVSIAVAETLCDHETPVWLDSGLSEKPVIDHLRFTCGCPLVEAEEKAAFAFFSVSPNVDLLRAFPSGTPSYPDRSTTVVIQVDALGNDGPLRLTGPGIKGAKSLDVSGLKQDFWSWRQENLQKFPLGIDVLLASPTHLAALPRTTVVMEVA